MQRLNIIDFFFNGRRLGIRIFFNDIKLFLIGFSNYSTTTLNFFNHGQFTYWLESSSELGLLQYKKHIVRDYIINNLNLSLNNKSLSLNTFL